MRSNIFGCVAVVDPCRLEQFLGDALYCSQRNTKMAKACPPAIYGRINAAGLSIRPCAPDLEEQGYESEEAGYQQEPEN